MNILILINKVPILGGMPNSGLSGAHKIKFFIKDFSANCGFGHTLLKKLLMENVIFFSVVLRCSFDIFYFSAILSLVSFGSLRGSHTSDLTY